jgi:two-component system, LytTR family, sensor kinase
MAGNLIFRWVFIRNYLIFMILVMLVHFVLLHYYYSIPLVNSVIDALISYMILFVILINLWFVVKFARTESVSSFTSIRNSTIAVIILVIGWLFLSKHFLGLIFHGNMDYMEFLLNSLVLRAIAGISIAGLIYSSFFLAIYQNSVEQSLKRENELRLMVQKTELQALKNQLNPHFIYNSLNSISSLTIYSPEKAREMVVMLSDFLRVALRQDALQKASLAEELENISLYLQIEKIRFEEKLQWEFDVKAEHLNFQIPVLILQPLFENAVKHGVQQSSHPGKIILNSRLSNQFLELTVQNTYDKSFQSFRGEGVGIENVRNRLRLIYGGSAHIKLNALDNIFEASIIFPLQDWGV